MRDWNQRVVRCFRMLGSCLLVLAAAGAWASGQEVAPSSTEPVYRRPSQPLAAIVEAPLPPGRSLAPGLDMLLVMRRPSLPSIAELAEPELGLAGLRIRPRTNGPSRTFSYDGLELVNIATGKARQVSGLPEAARIENVRWSPDGSHVAFTETTADGIELWVVDVAAARARVLTAARLNLAAQAPPVWLADGSGLVVALVPSDRGPQPVAEDVPSGPVIQESLGKTAPARTFQDLLAGPYDEALLEHFLTAQLARVDLDGTVTPLGAPGLVWAFDPSPDGRFLLVEMLHRPFSYLVPAGRFPCRVEIWDRRGTLVRQLADLPLRENVPITFGSVPAGMREIEWRADQPATVAWAEAQDGGDAGAKAEVRDHLLQLRAPFSGEPEVLAALELRLASVSWGDDDLAIVSEWWWRTRQVRSWRIKPGTSGAAAQLLWERSFEDRYADPGRPTVVSNRFGRRVIQRAGADAIFLTGSGASAEGDRPFLDRFDLRTLASERLLRSEAPYFERPLQPLGSDGRQVLVSRESVASPPNVFVRDLGSGALRQITHEPNPTPQLQGISKELIAYQRADGVQLNATLYLPAGYDAERDGPLPMVMWAYPQEFKSADAAGQVRDSPYRFDRIGWYSPLLWLTRGYAVLDNPSMPIVGEGDAEPNDTYVEQLVVSAAAAVDEVVRRGVADRHRIAIGGHSYGAFMTANLLAHSDLFAAGIARSGAYNRTLTPFGFQAEERTLWQAPKVYFEMSPFMHAETLDEPLLLIHGQADNNSGTFPMQSERLYDALKGLGGTVRLVMLPHESHGYRARESVLHMLWESERWLELYVRQRPRPIQPDLE